MTNLRLRVLAGILLSFIWVTANYAFASAESAPPSVLARAAIVSTPPPAPLVPHSTQPITSPTPTLITADISIRPVPGATPSEFPAEPSVPTTTSSSPITRTSVSPLRVPTEASPTPITRASVPQDLLDQRYPYYDKGPHIVTLQIELDMRSVDGIYGPQTRKAHINALGGPTAAVYIMYPEIGQTPTPCSHGCIPGDEHYLLPTLGSLINQYFLPEDRALARKIAFCESSGQTHHTGSDEVSSALAVGWFQHLAKYWIERSEKAGWKDYDPFNGRANVAVAAWLYYSSGVHHWNPSKACWGQASS